MAFARSPARVDFFFSSSDCLSRSVASCCSWSSRLAMFCRLQNWPQMSTREFIRVHSRSFVANYSLEAQCVHRFREIAGQSRLLLFQLGLFIAERGELLLVIVQLFGIVLHLLLLAGDVIEAGDVLPDAILVPGQRRHLRRRVG